MNSQKLSAYKKKMHKIKPVHIPAMSGEGPQALTLAKELLSRWLLDVGESELFFRVWALASDSCFSGWTHAHWNIGSTN